MNSIVNQYNIFLDTKYLNSGTNETPKFSIEDPITLINENNYFTAKILSAEIPFSFKTLASPYNILKVRVQETLHNIDTSSNITIQEGNYSIVSLLEELKNKLTAYLQTINVGNFQSHLPTFNFTYAKETGKVSLNIISGGGNHSVTITLLWGYADILAPYFGFTYLDDTILSYNSSGVVTSQNFTSPNMVNVSPITALYIRSSSLNQARFNQERMVEYSMTISDILLRIPVNSYYNTWLMYENNSFEVRLNNKIIDDISLYLTSLTYDAINLNGVNWKVLLQITEYESAVTQKIKLQQEERLKSLQQKRVELMNELSQVRDELMTEAGN